jgi:hypothetical protein
VSAAPSYRPRVSADVLLRAGMHVEATIDGIPCAAVATFSHHTYGGVAHWLVGMGAEGKLLAVYEAVTYRGDFFLGDRVHGISAPSDVKTALTLNMAAIVDADWRMQ